MCEMALSNIMFFELRLHYKQNLELKIIEEIQHLKERGGGLFGLVNHV